MNANERLVSELYAVANAVFEIDRPLAARLLEALTVWQRMRMQEIRRVTDWLDELAHTMPGMPLPLAPSEFDDEEEK